MTWRVKITGISKSDYKHFLYSYDIFDDASPATTTVSDSCQIKIAETNLMKRDRLIAAARATKEQFDKDQLYAASLAAATTAHVNQVFNL